MIKKFEEYINVSQIDFVNESSYAPIKKDMDYPIEDGPYILRLEFTPVSNFCQDGYRTNIIAFENTTDVKILLESVDVAIKNATENGKSVITGIDINKHKDCRPHLLYNEMFVYPFSDIEEAGNFIKTFPTKVKSGYFGYQDFELLSTKKISFRYGFTKGKEIEGMKYLMDLFKENEGRTGLIG